MDFSIESSKGGNGVLVVSRPTWSSLHSLLSFEASVFPLLLGFKVLLWSLVSADSSFIAFWSPGAISSTFYLYDAWCGSPASLGCIAESVTDWSLEYQAIGSCSLWESLAASSLYQRFISILLPEVALDIIAVVESFKFSFVIVICSQDNQLSLFYLWWASMQGIILQNQHWDLML